MKVKTCKNIIEKNPEFISLVIAGDNLAVEKFYCILLPYIKFVIRKLGFVFRINEIDSLSNDIFLKIYNKLAKLDPNRSIYSWIYSLIKNYLIDLKRQENKLTISVDETPELIHSIKVLKTPEELYEKKEELNHLNSLLNRLKSEDKKLIEDFYFAGLSLKELQQKYNYPSQNAISIRLFRAKQLLRDKSRYSRKFNII